jgi:ubiquitin carboxyl-terminal hydrolase 34
MWQICGYIPQTLLSQGQDFTEISAQLSTSFFIETFIHAKEKVSCHYVYIGTLVVRE